jgi:hypothetical protein
MSLLSYHIVRYNIKTSSYKLWFSSPLSFQLILYSWSFGVNLLLPSLLDLHFLGYILRILFVFTSLQRCSSPFVSLSWVPDKYDTYFLFIPLWDD